MICDLYKDDKIQIIMINGKNKKSFDTIANMKLPENIKVVNVGFTDKVDLYMSASDVIVTKLGGTGATEAINKLRPMIVTNKVFGQEKHNLTYLSNKGITYSFKGKKDLKAVMDKFKNDQEFYNKTVENIKKLRTNGIDNLAKIIMSFDKAKYDEKYIESIDYSKVKRDVKKKIKLANKQEKQNHKIQKKKGK